MYKFDFLNPKAEKYINYVYNNNRDFWIISMIINDYLAKKYRRKTVFNIEELQPFVGYSIESLQKILNKMVYHNLLYHNRKRKNYYKINLDL